MRYLLLFLGLNIQYAALSQEKDLSLPTLPLRNGHISKIDERSQYFCLRMKSDGVVIQSKTDSCFTTSAGVVTSILDLGGGFAILSCKVSR